MATLKPGGRLEHLLVDRITPLLLIVVVPLLVAMWVQNRENVEARRDQLRAACERGNDARRDQGFMFDYLLQTGVVVEAVSTDPEIRRYFRASTNELQARRDALEQIDCEAVIP